jgi:hypothetical protein
MRKIITLSSIFILLLTGCVAKNNVGTNSGNVGGNTNSQNKNSKMIATVKQISYKDDKITSILVLDDKNSEFVFAITEKVEFTDIEKLKTGDKLEIEHSGEIRESYPAQGTALKITILESQTSEVVAETLYSVLPIRGGYSDTIFEKTMNSLNIFIDILDDKAEFDKYINDINFESENKINIPAKYSDEFFKTKKLIFIAKSTSSTPTFSINSLSKSQNQLNVVIEEKTSEMQTTDILLKGFLIEVDHSIISITTSVSIEYLYKIVTK